MTEMDKTHRALQIAGINVDLGKVKLFMEFKKLLDEKGMEITIGEIEQVGRQVHQQILREQSSDANVNVEAKLKAMVIGEGGEA
jgi:hypothetical protein